jgi:fructoselysine-6-P-deglycase FrlB-like protein
MVTDDRSWYDPNAFPELRDGPPWVMDEMIAAEPELVEAIVRTCDPDPVAALLRADGRHLVVGCGTSEHAALGIAAQLRDAGVDAVSEQALESRLHPSGAAASVLAVSHEGGTWATEQKVAAARAAGTPTALVTAEPAGSIAPLVDALLVTPLRDRSWCHTVGYLSPLVAGAVLAASISGSGLDAGRLAEPVRRGLEQRAAAAAVAAALAECDRLIVIGSGTDRIAARELTLKVEEACHLPTAMRELETMLHGHLPATGPGTGLVLIDTDPEPGDRRRRTETMLAACARVGIACAAIASAPVPAELVSAGAITADRGRLSGAAASLLASAVPLQLLSLELALARDRNPDLIRREQEPYRAAAAIVEGA